MQTYAYIRVSSLDQNEARQLEAIQELAIPQRNIYMDKQSGKDFHRENIKKRQSQGISAAKAKGIRFGRPEACVPKNFVSLVKRWRNRQIPLKVLLKACSISRSTFFRKIQEMGL